MAAQKTRCKKCVHAEKKANQAPCSMCAEIYPSLRKFENVFLMASKKRVRRIKTNEVTKCSREDSAPATWL